MKYNDVIETKRKDQIIVVNKISDILYLYHNLFLKDIARNDDDIDKHNKAIKSFNVFRDLSHHRLIGREL